MNKAEEMFENLTQKETLKEHLTFIALFISLYESFVEKMLSDVESLLCDVSGVTIKNEKLKFKQSKKYMDLIKNRKVDDLGNKDPLKATMLWYVDAGAMSEKEYQKFLEIKKKRNEYTHEMTKFLCDGLYEYDAKLLVETFDLFCKIDKWWINEIEIPIAGDYMAGEYDETAVQSVLLLTYKVMINTLYSEHGFE